MKYSDIIEKLRQISPDECENEAKILIEHFTKKRISYYLINGDEDIDCADLELALNKREKHVPLQYIIGKWEFYRQTPASGACARRKPNSITVSPLAA